MERCKPLQLARRTAPSVTYRSLPRALLLLLTLGSGASALEAQQSRYLVELGAGGLYQSFDAVSKLGSTFGGVPAFGLAGAGGVSPGAGIDTVGPGSAGTLGSGGSDFDPHPTASARPSVSTPVKIVRDMAFSSVAGDPLRE